MYWCEDSKENFFFLLYLQDSRRSTVVKKPVDEVLKKANYSNFFLLHRRREREKEKCKKKIEEKNRKINDHPDHRDITYSHRSVRSARRDSDALSSFYFILE